MRSRRAAFLDWLLLLFAGFSFQRPLATGQPLLPQQLQSRGSDGTASDACAWIVIPLASRGWWWCYSDIRPQPRDEVRALSSVGSPSGRALAGSRKELES